MKTSPVHWLTVSLLFMLPSSGEGAESLVTEAEKSSWKRTGRLSEVVSLCQRFERAYPKFAKCVRFGTSPEGRPMVALEVASPGASASTPVVFFQGGIHAGEIAGKDAGFLFLRQLLAQESPTLKLSWLNGVRLLFIPVLNVDGHERFSANNRPNQNGPEEMGWRTTAHNLNLNRDWLKAESSEMRQLLQYLVPKNPIVAMDLHTTDGADFQPNISVLVAPAVEAPEQPEPLRSIGARLQEQVIELLKKKGHLALPFYPVFLREDDPSSGFELVPSAPRYSQSYWALRRRIGILVEAHSYKPYANRVQSTRDVLEAVVSLAFDQAPAWIQASQKTLQLEKKNTPGKKIPLQYERTQRSREIEFPGYAYERKPSTISGQLRITYDPSSPKTWNVPLHEESFAKVSVTAPKKGYLIPPAYAEWAIPRLKLHGVEFRKTVQEEKQTWVEAFRAEQFAFAKQPFEGRMRLESIHGGWRSENRTLPPGSVWVPIEQPLAHLVVHLLEPQAPDSWLAWGFFNAAFEKKEYLEAHVAEGIAERMLKEQPVLKAEFEALVSSDPDFAKSPERRLEFFHRRHPSWDMNYGLYPIFRR